MKPRFLFFGLALFSLLMVAVTPVWAHAELLSSLPTANAVLDSPPTQVELFFSETLEPAFSSIRVLDAAGAQVDSGDSKVDLTDPTHLLVSLRPLPNGIYTVSWQVLSAVDGHILNGTFSFAVGAENAAALIAATQVSQEIELPLGEAIARWLLYLSTAILTGTILFFLTVWSPVCAASPTKADEPLADQLPWRRLITIALISLMVGQGWSLLLQAGQVVGEVVAAPWSPEVTQVLFTTRYGALWIIRLTLALILVGLLRATIRRDESPNNPVGRRRRERRRATPKIAGKPSLLTNPGAQPKLAKSSPNLDKSPEFLKFLGPQGLKLRTDPILRNQWLIAGVSLLLLLTISLGSHAATEATPFLPVLTDWLHLIAASAWIGGLLAFVTALWAVRGFDTSLRTQLAAGLISRFSALALLSVGLLILSGLYAAVLRIGTLTALTETLYGQTLLVKLAIALPMLALGAVNLGIIKPAMQRVAVQTQEGSSLLTRFRRLVSSEAALGVILLLSVGVLTAQPPPQLTSAFGLNASTEVDDLEVALNIAPGRVGFNTFTVYLTANGQPVENTKEVELRFLPKKADLAPSEVKLTGQGNGQYTASGAYFSLPDLWQVQASIRREDRFDSFANFEFDIVSAVAPPPTYSWHQVNGLLLIIEALAYFFAFSRLSKTRSQVVAFAAIPALALTVAGLATSFRTPTTETTETATHSLVAEQVADTPTPLKAEIVNPVPADTGSIAAGQALYESNCLECHGPSGKGDGSLSPTLMVPPADLSALTVPGNYSDGQFFEWISSGFPAAGMPAFKATLSEEERWHLVNYIRTLAFIYSQTK